ncbi:uncharacterized protein LOC141691093 [Apium graveolens]|uniref:uncharacterized protein LOC141691093 n=1 Tax=Apium graveolens TaxID=4045 RepID=UPI003D7AEA7B
MKNSENIGEFVTRLKAVTNKMKKNGESLDDVLVMKKLLHPLTRKFDYVVTSIEESKDLSTILIDELVGSLQAHEQRMNQYDDASHLEKAFYECRAPKVEERSHFAAAKKEKDVGSAMFLTYKGDEEGKKNIWYLDSDASNHMSDHKDLFTEINETVTTEVTFSDSSKIPVKGKGTITIVLKNGEKKYINDVYYILALKSNIINLGQLVEKGYNIQSRIILLPSEIMFEN